MKKEIVVYTPQTQLSIPDTKKLLHACGGRIIDIPARLRGILTAIELWDPHARNALTSSDMQMCQSLREEIVRYFRSLPVLERYLSQITDAYPGQEKYVFDIALDGWSTGLPIRSSYVVEFHDNTEILRRFEVLYYYKWIPPSIGAILEKLSVLASDFSISVRAAFSLHPESLYYDTHYTFTLKYIDEYGYPQKLEFTYTPENRSIAHWLLLRLHPSLTIDWLLAYVDTWVYITSWKLDEIVDDVFIAELDIPDKSLQYLLESYKDTSLTVVDRQQILDIINTNHFYQTLLNQRRRSVSRLTRIFKRTTSQNFCLFLFDKTYDTSNDYIIFLDYEHARETLEIVNKITCKRIERNDFAERTHITFCITGKKIPNASAVCVTINLFSDQVDCRHTFTCMISIEQLFELMQLLCDTQESLENNLFRSGVDDTASWDTESGYGYTTEQ